MSAKKNLAQLQASGRASACAACKCAKLSKGNCLKNKKCALAF